MTKFLLTSFIFSDAANLGLKAERKSTKFTLYHRKFVKTCQLQASVYIRPVAGGGGGGGGGGCDGCLRTPQEPWKSAPCENKNK